MNFNKILERLEKIEDLLQQGEKNVLNIEEVSQLTGLSKSTLYKSTSNRNIPHYKKSKHLFFDRLEIESWLKSNRVKTANEIDTDSSTYITLNNGGMQL